MTKLARGGYLISHINLLNGRLFNKMLAEEEGAVYSGEQGKILSCLWIAEPLTATDIAIKTGLANNTLTKMLQRLETQGLIVSSSHPKDKRKRCYYLTELGKSQEAVGEKVSQALGEIFYKDFSQKEIQQFEKMLTKVMQNLEAASPRWKEKL
ncbi:MarR family winged helix-turn-helix transcriptional regulator [Streptococcus ratti]|uniref:MarR family transcriptional regulator n=1 Tax=Streptococcus ratti TaxID=1341 RepID=A0A7X9LDY6_STRRT|nr:MarR family transcriptional regulator [Streptococcus ratti]NMD48095.1 MarR family transcriptional regulator [Streptococcus ratti]